MAKKSKAEKGNSIAVPSKMRPTMHLDGKDAEALKGVAVGSPVRMEVHGKVQSASEHQYDGEEPRHSVSVELHKIKHKPAKHKTGRVGGKEADAADGAKAAMDEALED